MHVSFTTKRNLKCLKNTIDKIKWSGLRYKWINRRQCIIRAISILISNLRDLIIRWNCLELSIFIIKKM